MTTTKMSSKGQIVLPKELRDSRGWQSGTEFEIEEQGSGILLRPVRRWPATTLDEVVGMLKWHGKPVTVEEMDEGIRRHVRKKFGR